MTVYFLEDYDDNSGRFYLTANVEKVEKFNQEDNKNCLKEDILADDNYKRLKKYSEKCSSIRTALFTCCYGSQRPNGYFGKCLHKERLYTGRYQPIRLFWLFA